MPHFEFVPTKDQIENSNIHKFMTSYGIFSLEQLSQKAKDDPEWFWKGVENYAGVVWDQQYQKVLDLSRGMPFPSWFVGGKTNIYKSSVEKHSKTHPGKTAYTFVSEDGKTSHVSYLELDKKVCKLANSLRSLGVQRGGRCCHLHAHDRGVHFSNSCVCKNRSGSDRDLFWLQLRIAADKTARLQGKSTLCV